MPTRALHVSDLHAGRRDTPGIGEALAALVADVRPSLVLATGDLAHRGRTAELERAHELLASLGPPLVAVPGNHDIPYTPLARATRPWERFEQVFATTDPVHRSDTAVVFGVDSVRPWRHQGGRISAPRLARLAEELRDTPPGPLRIVALHHHLAGSPWRAARKLPLRHRDRVLATLAAAGAELVLSGHIHQASAADRREFAVDGDLRPLVLATAPGLGRPRPHRAGEAHGALVHEWDDERLSVLTYLLRDGRFVPTARRDFARGYAPRAVSQEEHT